MWDFHVLLIIHKCSDQILNGPTVPPLTTTKEAVPHGGISNHNKAHIFP